MYLQISAFVIHVPHKGGQEFLLGKKPISARPYRKYICIVKRISGEHEVHSLRGQVPTGKTMELQTLILKP
jgi:hypothetical protein